MGVRTLGLAKGWDGLGMGSGNDEHKQEAGVEIRSWDDRHQTKMRIRMVSGDEPELGSYDTKFKKIMFM